MMMCAEPELLTEMFVHREDSSLFSRVEVDPQNCKIVLGKTRVHWWNYFINDKREFSLIEFVAHARTMLSNRMPENKRFEVANALQTETEDNLIRLGKTNEVIDRLFSIGYFGVKTAWSNTTLGTQGAFGNQDPADINLNIDGRDIRETFVLPGSGESIIDLIVGVKDVKVRQY